MHLSSPFFIDLLPACLRTVVRKQIIERVNNEANTVLIEEVVFL